MKASQHFIILTLSLSFPSAFGKPLTNPCITAEDSQKEVTRWSDFLKKSFNSKEGIPESMVKKLEDSCWKKKFRLIDRFNVVIYKNPENSEETTGSFLNPIREQERPKDKCIKDALRVIKDLKLDWVNRIIDHHRSKYGWMWNDSDLGPGQYLECPKQDNVSFFDSISLMLHELNHLNAKPPCVYDPFSNQERCIDKDLSLLEGTGIKLESFPTTIEKERAGLESIQRMYLEAIPQVSLFNLINELMGYSISLQTVVGTLSTKGYTAVFAEDGRQTAISNLFMVYVIRYMQQFKKLNPTDYPTKFGPKTETGKQVEAVLKLGEDSYHGLEKALQKAKKPLKEFETGLWKQYEISKESSL